MGREAEGDDASLLVGIGAGDDGDGHHVAAVDGQVRDARRDVAEVAGLDRRAIPQADAVPDPGLAADGIDGGLVAVMMMASPGAVVVVWGMWTSFVNRSDI